MGDCLHGAMVLDGSLALPLAAKLPCIPDFFGYRLTQACLKLRSKGADREVEELNVGLCKKLRHPLDYVPILRRHGAIDDDGLLVVSSRLIDDSTKGVFLEFHDTKTLRLRIGSRVAAPGEGWITTFRIDHGGLTDAILIFGADRLEEGVEYFVGQLQGAFLTDTDFGFGSY